ncbi:MAG: NAD+ synthase, partial [Candidatus Omnitrophica bacterium]|nr:NAD+ synthase [Candidatus Omnitrophota bacterium]
SPYHQGKLSSHIRILKDQAVYNKTIVCYTNLVGGQDELVFDGGSLVIDSKGKILNRAKQFKEDLVITDIKISPKHKKIPKSKKIILDPPDFQKKPALPAPPKVKDRTLSRLEQVYRALVLGTHDYVIKNGFKKAVIGLSGGIDSALTTVIAVDALGKDNVTVVTMPSKYTSKATRTDAQRQAESLGVKLITLPIGRVWEQYLKLLKNEFKGSGADITEENLQARIRGNLLMALSNKFGWLVLSTGNKSEMGVGYCTLYGDMAGGFAVIKDVPKTLVYELAVYRNKTAVLDLIPKSVIKRAPTAELKPGQKDQDSLPAYAKLDPILEAYIEQHKSLDDIIKKGYSAKVVKKVIRMVDRSEYKRRQGPPGVKITPLVFGKDRRLPIVNYYKVK